MVVELGIFSNKDYIYHKAQTVSVVYDLLSREIGAQDIGKCVDAEPGNVLS